MIEEFEPRVYDGFSDWENVAYEFQADIGPEPEFIYARYVQPPYEGIATIIFRRDGKWWLVYASHCSCYGLEDQWAPQEFFPEVHLAAKDEDKRIAVMLDGDGDRCTKEQKKFDDWLAWAIGQS